MYAEKMMPVVRATTAETFIHTLQSRLADMPTESKRNRVKKIITQMQKIGW